MTQFEGGVVLAEQLRRLWIEGNGGGNNGESYLAAHFAAGMKTSTDSFEKRGRKGFLFTMGRRAQPRQVSPASRSRACFGLHSARDLTAADCLAIARAELEAEDVRTSSSPTGYGYASQGRRRRPGVWPGHHGRPLQRRARQACSTTMVEDRTDGRHVFDLVGSCSFHGAATYLWHDVVSSPMHLVEELVRRWPRSASRRRSGRRCRAGSSPPPFDMILNQAVEAAGGTGRHGSCGYGVGETVERAHLGIPTILADQRRRHAPARLVPGAPTPRRFRLSASRHGLPDDPGRLRGPGSRTTR